MITKLRDCSHQFLEQRAASTVRETAECVATRNLVGGLTELIERKIMGHGASDLSAEDKNSDSPCKKKCVMWMVIFVFNYHRGHLSLSGS